MNSGSEHTEDAGGGGISNFKFQISNGNHSLTPAISPSEGVTEKGQPVFAVIASSDDSTFLPPRELQQLRKEQEKFVRGLAIRLSQDLRLEFSLELASLEIVSYQKLAQSWENPSHLALFKLEPLRGVSVLEIPPRLGLAMADRLLGGPGEANATDREISEIEQALLEPTVQMLLEEWCGQWSGVKNLKPAILGCESNGRFIQITTPETMMLVLGLEAALGECRGRIQMGFPLASLEPLMGALTQPNVESESASASRSPDAATACKWNACFDDVQLPVTAEWEGLELTSRAV